VVDHYAADTDWESVLRPAVGRLMVIDDMADRPHACDLLLDQNVVADMHARYAGRVGPDTVMLLGPEFALLQREYAALHRLVPLRDGPVRSILVFFGGADADDFTGKSLAAILRLGGPTRDVHIVLSAGSPHHDDVRKIAGSAPGVHVHGALPTLAHLMARADLAVGAGGATSYERLCLGLPAVVVTLADNQRPVAQELHERGLIRWLGHRDTVTEEVIWRALDALASEGISEAWSRACHDVVDGRGVDRVCAVMTAGPAMPLRARHATPADESLVLDWANDPTTRRHAFSPEPISATTHHRWFAGKLRNVDGCQFYIVETQGEVPVGQVRFERAGEDWEVHYALSRPFRGRGVGAPLLNAALAAARSSLGPVRIHGRVKRDNIASQRVFQGLGFETHGSDEDGVVTFRRAC
jgi:UDP-2,4-diacetamido-2,4,6-trideoxy-beta-L-altropyranose hydrolase